MTRQFEAIAAQRGMTLSELASLAGVEDRQDAGAWGWGRGRWRGALQSCAIAAHGGLIRAADCAVNAPRRVSNRILGTSLPLRRRETPIDLAGMVDLLMRVHAFEIFEAGVFNADPHPGNILLLSDGRVGLIDYGQVKRLPLDKRVKYAKLITLLAANDRKGVVAHAVGEMGFATERMDEDVIYRILCFFNDRDDAEITGNRNVQQFMVRAKCSLSLSSTLSFLSLFFSLFFSPLWWRHSMLTRSLPIFHPLFPPGLAAEGRSDCAAGRRLRE